jgi:hypothetical protein
MSKDTMQKVGNRKQTTSLAWLQCCGLALLLATSAGCIAVVAGAAAGGGAYAYSKGEVVSSEPTTLDRTWKAVEAGVKELQFVVEVKEKDALSARMETRGANDKRVIIKLRNINEKVTEIRIRVGLFGDESYSRQVLDKVRANL